jgi:hypothetical protein
MAIPQLLVDLLTLLFNLAVPAAMCTLVLAGVALRHEGGLNFEMGGRFHRWMLWSAILLTLPQFLSWFAGRGISMPPQASGFASSWLTNLQGTFSSFVSDIVVGRLVPVLAAFFVLKAVLDGAEGKNPLGSVIAAMFLLSVSGTLRMMQLKQFAGEISAMSDQVQPESIHVICCDEQVSSVQEFGPSEPIVLNPIGGGGTNFRPVFEWVEEHNLVPACLIYLTDLECHRYPDSCPRYPVLWVTNSRRTAPFGETLRMRPEQNN